MTQYDMRKHATTPLTLKKVPLVMFLKTNKQHLFSATVSLHGFFPWMLDRRAQLIRYSWLAGSSYRA